MKHFMPALRMLIFMTILTGVVYPLTVTGITSILFSKKATGSFLEKDGQIVGSEHIAQKFEKPDYFWSRPSAGDYNPLPSGGTNQGQASAVLKAQVIERAAKLKDANGTADTPPQDLLFASASGLDPHISPEAAQYQIARVARVRSLDVEKVQTLVKANTEPRQFGFLGEPRVNVLRLNIALDNER